MDKVTQALFAMQDTGYRDFQAPLIPTLDPETVIGVRVPQLRRYAKAFQRDADCAVFLTELPHRYFDENMLHALLLSAMDLPTEAAFSALTRFLPYIDNWSVCDTLSPRFFDRDPARVYALCCDWLDSPQTYTVRFAVVTLLRRFLDGDFDPAMLARLASLRTDEYYINMAVAWYLSFALIKQYDAALPCFTQPVYDPWVHNKAIQKAVESFRVPPERKAFLKTLRLRREGNAR